MPHIELLEATDVPVELQEIKHKPIKNLKLLKVTGLMEVNIHVELCSRQNILQFVPYQDHYGF